MKSSDFPYYRQPFEEYNHAQSLVVPYLADDCNLVVSLQTATGKTALAEAAFAFHLAASPISRVCYVAPLKSICSEKVSEWSSEPQLAMRGVGVISSDHADERDAAMDSGLVVCTIESIDSLSRSPVNEEWLKSLSIVVIDEAHFLGMEARGAALESFLMRLSMLNPGCRLFLMSGTMSNAKDIAVWVKSLNGKATKLIRSPWKPHSVDVVYHEVDSYHSKLSVSVGVITDIAKESKVIVFVHSKATGKELQKMLSKKKIRNVFHHSSVSAKNRTLMEEAFSNNDSLRVLISTSTLGAGVNIL